jgi:hypothetical protein
MTFNPRLSSAALSLAALALPPFPAIEAISALKSLAARTGSPKAPSACAFGLFSLPMPTVIVLSRKHVKNNCRLLPLFCELFGQSGDPPEGFELSVTVAATGAYSHIEILV